MSRTTDTEGMEERRHCLDHTGMTARDESLGSEIRSNFTTVKWLLGSLAAMVLCVGSYILGQQATLDKFSAVTASEVKEHGKRIEKVESDIDYIAKNMK